MTGVVGDDGHPVTEDAVQFVDLRRRPLLQQCVEAGEQRLRRVGPGECLLEHLLDAATQVGTLNGVMS